MFLPGDQGSLGWLGLWEGDMGRYWKLGRTDALCRFGREAKEAQTQRIRKLSS